jgi:hypothetical protein
VFSLMEARQGCSGLDGRGEAGGRQTTHNDCINGSRGWVFPVWEPIHLMGAVEASGPFEWSGNSRPICTLSIVLTVH